GRLHTVVLEARGSEGIKPHMDRWRATDEILAALAAPAALEHEAREEQEQRAREEDNGQVREEISASEGPATSKDQDPVSAPSHAPPSEPQKAGTGSLPQPLWRRHFAWVVLAAVAISAIVGVAVLYDA